MQGNLRGSSMALPWPTLGSKAGCCTQSVPAGCFQSMCYLPSIVRVRVLHFTAWPAHLKTPSHAESSEWPRPNWKRRNWVGQSVTLALDQNCYLPKQPFQSLLINDLAHTKTQFRLSPTNTYSKALLTIWIVDHIKSIAFPLESWWI